MGISTISMAIFHSYVSHYQRVTLLENPRSDVSFAKQLCPQSDTSPDGEATITTYPGLVAGRTKLDSFARHIMKLCIYIYTVVVCIHSHTYDVRVCSIYPVPSL